MLVGGRSGKKEANLNGRKIQKFRLDGGKFDQRKRSISRETKGQESQKMIS